MKILHIIPGYYPAIEFGGPTESVLQLNRALVNKGITVDVLTTDAGLKGRKDIVLNKWIIKDKMRIKYFPCYLLGNYAFSLNITQAIFSEINRYDLVHLTAIWSFPFLVGGIASLLSKKPYLISPRGMLYDEAINIKSKRFKKLYYSLILKCALEKANAIHFTTEDEKGKVSSFVKLSNESFVVPNGIDLNLFNTLPIKNLFKDKYPILKNKKYILYLGRINKQKGLDILLESFQELVKKFEDLILVVAGPDNDDYRNEMERWLKNRNLSSKVLFTGILKGDDKLSAYVDAELFVLPSYFENFGMSVVEAMACGTPVVISSRVGIYKEVEQSKSGIVVETNPGSLFDGINMLLNNASLKKEIAGNGKMLVKNKYDINKVADMMIDTYKEVINCRKN